LLVATVSQRPRRFSLFAITIQQIGFVVDTFVVDTFVVDTFVVDTFVVDTFVVDTFVADSFVADSLNVNHNGHVSV